MYPESVRPPVLSICVPTFNRARFLECQLEDLSNRIGALGHTYELLIGDNASDDNTADVARRYKDRLNIRYFRWQENVGPFPNRAKLFAAAEGRYAVYLADDDLLIPEVLGRYIDYLDANPDVGAVFAPWFLHNRVSGVDFDQFYVMEQETRIDARDHISLFNLLVNGHIFPEIYVARTALAREVAGPDNLISFMFFVQIAEMVDRTAVTFGSEPFYRFVTRYFEDEVHTHAGNEEVKIAWDRYRGGLECILSRFASLLDAENLSWCHRAIDHFTRVRMYVGLRLRTADGHDWVENYYLATRLRCVGDDSLLPAPYETYRINAALEHLLGLQPFLPQRATVAYYADDPPRILSQARDFATADLVVLQDRSLPLPQNVILLVSGERGSAGSAGVVVSEAELLAKFP